MTKENQNTLRNVTITVLGNALLAAIYLYGYFILIHKAEGFQFPILMIALAGIVVVHLALLIISGIILLFMKRQELGGTLVLTAGLLAFSIYLVFSNGAIHHGI